jgi:spore coat protein CotH
MYWLAMTSVLAISLPQSACGQNSGTPKAEDYYRADEVQSVHVRVAAADLKRMTAALPERIYVKASFRWRDISLDNVAIRFKGNSSSGPNQRHKRSFLVKFNEYDEDQRFLGLRRVSFDNGVQFGSLFSEPIITEILRDQGVVTHRANYARLFLNDEYQGVYVNVERIDESFLASHLPDANGLLFKVDEGGPGCNLQFLGDDPAAYERAFEAETKASKQMRQQLVAFIKMLHETGAGDFEKKLEAELEVDDFLRVSAVMLFAGAFDQLTGWNPHNYYLYRDGQHDRWRYLPWDLDVGFCEIAFGRVRVLDDWNAAWPLAGQQPNPLMERIVNDPALLRRYRAAAGDILEKHFEPEKLCARIDSKYALIKQDLQTDPFPPRRITNPDDKGYEDIVASMKEFARQRYASARRQLKDPGERPPMVRRPEGPPPQIAAKMQKLQQRIQAMQRRGDDLQPIQKLMQQLGPLLRAGEIDKAEALITEALKLTGD